MSDTYVQDKLILYANFNSEETAIQMIQAGYLLKYEGFIEEDYRR